MLVLIERNRYLLRGECRYHNITRWCLITSDDWHSAVLGKFKNNECGMTVVQLLLIFQKYRLKLRFNLITFTNYENFTTKTFTITKKHIYDEFWIINKLQYIIPYLLLFLSNEYIKIFTLDAYMTLTHGSSWIIGQPNLNGFFLCYY